MKRKKSGWGIVLAPLLVLAVAALAVAFLLWRDIPAKRDRLQAQQAQLTARQQQVADANALFTEQQGQIRQQRADNDETRLQLEEALALLDDMEAKFGPLDDGAATG